MVTLVVTTARIIEGVLQLLDGLRELTGEDNAVLHGFYTVVDDVEDILCPLSSFSATSKPVFVKVKV